MHPERGEVTEAAATQIRAATRVVAVGTTTLRLLESAATEDGVQPFAGDTSLFIRPGFRFRAVHRLMTNFHLPHSTLFMLVCAFAGTERMRAAYAHAIAEGLPLLQLRRLQPARPRMTTATFYPPPLEGGVRGGVASGTSSSVVLTEWHGRCARHPSPRPPPSRGGGE